jgi:hypothetical protein
LSTSANITNDPVFDSVNASDYRLLEGSPCIDASTNMPWMTGAMDLDGDPRIHDGTVDMGCYEWVPEPAAAVAAVFALLWAARRSEQ